MAIPDYYIGVENEHLLYNIGTRQICASAPPTRDLIEHAQKVANIIEYRYELANNVVIEPTKCIIKEKYSAYVAKVSSDKSTFYHLIIINNQQQVSELVFADRIVKFAKENMLV